MGTKRAVSVIELTKNAKRAAKSIRAPVLKSYFTLNNTGMFLEKCWISYATVGPEHRTGKQGGGARK